MRPSIFAVLKAGFRFAVLLAIVGPLENAFFGWADWKLGLTNEIVDKSVKLVLEYGIPAVTVFVIFVLWFCVDYFLFSRWKRERAQEQFEAEQSKRHQQAGPDPLPASEVLISMAEASRRAYEEARKAGSLWAYAAESEAKRARDSGAATESILSFMATLISGKVPLFGFCPPSQVLEEIDLRNQTGIFREAGTEWGRIFGNRTIYSGLSVRKADLDQVLDYIRNSHKTNDPI